jgi:hypothetical protein
MKNPVALLMIIFTLYSCKSEQVQLISDLKQANIKGKVRKIDRTIHDTENKCACAIKKECNESKYVYDLKGNLLESYTIDEDGAINDSSVYTYNRRGICTEIKKFSARKLTGKDVPVTEGGKISEVRTYDENGKIQSTLKYKYSGNEISEEITYNNLGEIVSVVQKEYSDGQVVAETEKDSSSNVISVSSFRRNSSNDVLECLVKVTKDNQEYKFTYEYDYDNSGNWIKQTKFYDGKILNIVLRNIEYFKV